MHIRVLATTIHIVHLQAILGLILCIAVLLAQLLLLVQQELLWTVIVDAVGRLVVARGHHTVLVVLVVQRATRTTSQILRLAMLDRLIA